MYIREEITRQFDSERFSSETRAACSGMEPDSRYSPRKGGGAFPGPCLYPAGSGSSRIKTRHGVVTRPPGGGRGEGEAGQTSLNSPVAAAKPRNMALKAPVHTAESRHESCKADSKWFTASRCALAVSHV